MDLEWLFSPDANNFILTGLYPTILQIFLYKPLASVLLIKNAAGGK